MGLLGKFYVAKFKATGDLVFVICHGVSQG